MVDGLCRGAVVWAEPDPTHGYEQAGRRSALVVAGDLYLEQADTLAVVVPTTTIRRGWPNYVLLRGPELVLRRPTYTMIEQSRTISRERIVDVTEVVDARTMAEVDTWLRDFLSLGWVGALRQGAAHGSLWSGPAVCVRPPGVCYAPRSGKVAYANRNGKPSNLGGRIRA